MQNMKIKKYICRVKKIKQAWIKYKSSGNSRGLLSLRTEKDKYLKLDRNVGN